MQQVKSLIDDGQLVKIDNKRSIAQIQLYDQFSNEFQDLIQKYNTTQSICGFTAIANAQAIKELSKNMGIMDVIAKLKQSKDIRRKYIEHAMSYVQKSRKEYIQKNQILSQQPKEAKLYMQDWVANYEISDYLRFYKNNDIYFIRNVAHDHPKAMAGLKYEEKERIDEELQFKGQGYFVDYGYENKFINRQKFKYSNNDVYIIDILGHFICSIVIKEGEQECILILETMKNDRIKNETLRQFYQY